MNEDLLLREMNNYACPTDLAVWPPDVQFASYVRTYVRTY